jgi:DNA-binding PadR family transcriptional regulator
MQPWRRFGASDIVYNATLDRIQDANGMKANVPDISHLQYLALGALMADGRSGRDLREQVRSFGVRRTRAAFYQFMARLERDGLVEGWYDQVQAGDQRVTERRYRITPEGRAAWKETHAFHEAVDRMAGARSSNA